MNIFKGFFEKIFGWLNEKSFFGRGKYQNNPKRRTQSKKHLDPPAYRREIKKRRKANKVARLSRRRNREG